MKQKKNSVVKEEQETKVETTKSGIGYKGEVTISLVRGGKTVKKTKHNTGTSKLFEVLAIALKGDTNLQNLVPQFIQGYIDVGHTSKKVFTTPKLRDDAEVVAEDTSDENSGYYLVLTFTIPYSTITRQTVRSLVLQNSQGDILAQISDADGFFTGDGMTTVKIE